MEAKAKIELKVFQENYVGQLFRQVIQTNNIDDYKKESFPYEERFPLGGTGIFIPVDFKLNGANDLENCRLLYEVLKDLNEVQASDERLWTYLTHVTFWEYMTKRWEVTDVNRVKGRYFLRTKNLETLTRNGISRLWWYAHLTYDAKRSNPYELTEVLLSRADLTVGLTERALGSNSNIRTAILEFLSKNPEIASNENKTRNLMKAINIIGGVRNLPLLEIDEINDLLEKIKLTS